MKPVSLKEMVSLVAQFGGHMGRNSDGDPGAKTIWQGLIKLQAYLFSSSILNVIK